MSGAAEGWGIALIAAFLAVGWFLGLIAPTAVMILGASFGAIMIVGLIAMRFGWEL